MKQKLLAAYNFGIKTVIIPELNLKDIKNLPNNIKVSMIISSYIEKSLLTDFYS